MDEAGNHDGLKYIGDGTALIGVPARDLSAAEATEHGRLRLLASGLYEEIVKKVYTPKPSRKSALKKEGITADHKENTK